MKKNILPIAAIALVMLTACGGAKSNEGNNDAAAVETTETEAPAAEEQALVVPEDPEAERGEVWTSLSGSYFFTNGDVFAAVSVALNEEEPSTFSYGEQEYRATVNKTTGQILAYDGDKLVFCGYAYDGGNSLGGNYLGERIFMQGPGD